MATPAASPPPALSPMTAMRLGSTPSSAAWPVSQTSPARRPPTGGGGGCSGASRYSRESIETPVRATYRETGPSKIGTEPTIIPPPCKYSTAAAVLSLDGWRYHLASSVAPSGVTTLWSEMSTLLATGCASLLKYPSIASSATRRLATSPTGAVGGGPFCSIAAARTAATSAFSVKVIVALVLIPRR